MKDENIRFIFMYGGSSSGKSYSLAQAIVLDTLEHGSNTLIFRKVGATIKNSIYEDFKTVISSLHLEEAFDLQQNQIKCFNGSRIDFAGLDDPEKIKGIANYKRVVLEELSEFEEVDIKQIRKRLRGKRGQQIIGMFNPISETHWIKKNLFDKENLTELPNHLYGILKDPISRRVLPKEYSEVSKKWINKERSIQNPKTGKYETHPADMVIIRSTYLNNFWVVGSPDGTYGYYDRQVIADFEKDKERDYDYYRIYALGEWGSIRTGGEFLPNFDPNKHKVAVAYHVSLPVHITIDNNVLPYISVGFWQIHPGDIKKAVQIHEIAAEDPFNSASKASALAVEYLESINHNEKVFLYGDQTTKARNTIDDEKRSFFDKFKEGLESHYIVEERMPASNPSVPLSGEFVDSIFANIIKSIEINIGDTCPKSLNDYICVKKDVNGGILKKRKTDKLTGQSYEEHGHFTDTMRYFIAEVFKDEYTKFSLRRKHNKNKEENMKYYKNDMTIKGDVHVEINPNINGKFVAVFSIVQDGQIYIYDAILSDRIVGIEEIRKRVPDPENANIQVECSISYISYTYDLRDVFDYVRGRTEIPYKQERIEANINIIQSFFFRNDYDSLPYYNTFFENMLEYKEKDNIEAMNSLAALAERIKSIKE